MNVNRPIDNLDRPAQKPMPAPAAKSSAGSFGDLLKNAQAASGPAPTIPQAAATPAGKL